MEGMTQREQHARDVEPQLKNTGKASIQEDFHWSRDVPDEHSDTPQAHHNLPCSHQDESDRCHNSQPQEQDPSSEPERPRLHENPGQSSGLQSGLIYDDTQEILCEGDRKVRYTELLSESSTKQSTEPWKSNDTRKYISLKECGGVSHCQCLQPPANARSGPGDDGFLEVVSADGDPLTEGALKQEMLALEARLAESESRRLKEVESLVEQLVEEQQARAQDTVKFKAMLAAVCQEKDLLVEDIEILQSSLAVEEAEHHDDSLKNNQIISGLKRQYNEDRLKEKIKSLTSSVEEHRIANESLIGKNKQLSNAMKKIKQELQEKMKVIQSQELQCSEMECEVRRLEQSLQNVENQWSAEVSNLHTQLCTTRHRHHAMLNSLLLEAVRSGFLHMVTQLLRDGADTEVVNIQSNKGQRALHVAAEEGHKEVTEALLEAGAQHTACNSHGSQPIHVAARQNHSEVVEVLLKHDPQLTRASDHQGWTVAELATSLGHLRVLQVLARLQEDILGFTTPRGHTLLHIAATNDQLHVSEWLLSKSRLGLREILRSHSVPYSQLVHLLVARCLVVAGWFRLRPLIWRFMNWWPMRTLGLHFYSWLKGKQKSSHRKENSSLRMQELNQQAVSPGGFSRACRAKRMAHHSTKKPAITTYEYQVSEQKNEVPS